MNTGARVPTGTQTVRPNRPGPNYPVRKTCIELRTLIRQHTHVTLDLMALSTFALSHL
jgi:hypothetical protein